MGMDIQRTASQILLSDLNYIQKEKAIIPELVGKRLFDTPIFGYGDPNDPYLLQLADVKDLKMKMPKEWLPSAETIISVFFPYSSELKKSSKIKGERKAFEWFHVRLEGQALIMSFLKEVKNELEQEGYEAVVPQQEKNFMSSAFRNAPEGMPAFSSNWSERHAAYACGLGTFSLTKALITEKGAAGRFGSILTSKRIERTERSYEGFQDNCSKCGKCIKRCPVSAISMDGKDNTRCADYLKSVFQEYEPYYGCSECQIGVPCESKIPKKGRP